MYDGNLGIYFLPMLLLVVTAYIQGTAEIAPTF